MSKRIKSNVPEIGSREEAAAMVAKVRAWTVSLQSLNAQRESDRAEVDAKYAPFVERAEAQLGRCTAALEKWANENPQEFPKGAKSLEFPDGRIGTRTGNPTVKTLRGYTWDRVRDVLQSLGLHQFLRQPPAEVDKEQLLIQRESLAPQDLAAWGIKIEQKETFYVEPAVETVDTRQTREAA